MQATTSLREEQSYPPDTRQTILPRHVFERAGDIEEPHRIVIVGGGAGGLELATRLGDRYADAPAIEIILVDRSATHLWKPLLHEIAAGSLDANTHQIEYVAQARWHHFEFQQGELTGADLTRKRIAVAAFKDEEGNDILPAREICYDTLVLAIGSVTNYFGVPGAREHGIAVDTVQQAEHFRHRLLAACMRTQNHMPPDHAQHTQRAPQVNIVIIGGGATGVELSAELRNAAEVLGAYGLHHLDPARNVRITVIEAGPRILGPLPEQVAAETARLLAQRNIDVLVAEKVTEVRSDAVITASGKFLPSDVTVWAAGIRMPRVLSRLGLAVSQQGQILVNQTLQSESDPAVFALGDCAHCPWPEKNRTVPPLAQAAHQQAAFLFHALRRRLAQQPLLTPFRFRERGALISVGIDNAVGNLSSRLTGRNVLVEGMLARFLYGWLYRVHLAALHGYARMLLDTLAQWLRGKTVPRIKLH